jgi:hypothetical protein
MASLKINLECHLLADGERLALRVEGGIDAQARYVHTASAGITVCIATVAS